MPSTRARNYLLRPGRTPADCLVINERVQGVWRLPRGSNTWEQVENTTDVDWAETAAAVVSTRSTRELPGWVDPVLEALAVPGLAVDADTESSDIGLLLVVNTVDATEVEAAGETNLEPEDHRWLLWTFGSGHLNFDRRMFVPDYGVRSVLNAAASIADQQGSTPTLKAINFVVGGSTRQRALHTAMESLQPEEFRMNTIADLLAGAGVAAHPLAGSADGTMGLAGTFELESVGQLVEVSSALLEQYDDDAYEQAFSFFAHRRPVIDLGLERDLDDDLYEALVADSHQVSGILPSLDERTVEVAYLAFPNERADSAPTTEPNRHTLASYAVPYGNSAFFDVRVRLLGENRQLVTHRYAKDLLYAELDRDGKSYVFSDGAWYEVELDYLEGLRARVSALRVDPNPDFPPYTNETEPNWLGGCAAVNQAFMVLDRQLIQVPGENSIEAADLIDLQGRLIHVKRRRSSSATTYVFHQAESAITVLARSEAARNELLHRIDQQEDVVAEPLFAAARSTVDDLAQGRRIEVVVVLLGSGGSSDPGKLPLNTKIAADEAVKGLASLKADLRICHWGMGLDND